MVCTKCGCKIPEGTAVCRVCGGTGKAEAMPVPRMDPAFFRAPDLLDDSEPVSVAPAVPEPVPVAPVMPEPMPVAPVVPEPVPVAPVMPEPMPVAPVVPEPMPVAPVMPEPVKAEKPGGASRTCPGCGKQLPADAKFCNVCGSSLAEAPAPAPAAEPVFEMPVISPAPSAPPAAAPAVCDACGAVLFPGAKFCNVCGKALSAAPAVTTAEKKVKTKKVKGEKSAKGLVIGIVAVALAIVVGLGTWIAVEDPFDWFASSKSSKDEDDDDDGGSGSISTSGMTAAEAAAKYMELQLSGDESAVAGMTHPKILEKRIVSMGFDEGDMDGYISGLAEVLDAQNSYYGSNYTHTSEPDCEITEDVSKESMIQTYNSVFDVDAEDYSCQQIKTTVTRDDGSREITASTLNMIKVDGQWYVADSVWVNPPRQNAIPSPGLQDDNMVDATMIPAEEMLDTEELLNIEQALRPNQN